MQTKHDILPAQSDRIVYVRPVASEDLPDQVRDQLGEAEVVYSVHNADGERLALVGDRKLAFVLARQHDFAPVSVH